MTKISGLPDDLRPVQQQNNKAQTTTEGLFKEAFDKALSGSGETKPPEQTSALPPLGGVSTIDYSTLETEQTDLNGITVKLLDKLDQYGNKLGNPDVTLKEIEPLISKIKEEATELSIAISKSNNSSPELKQLAGESAVSANTEYIKFMRGDYI